MLILTQGGAWTRVSETGDFG